MSELTLLLATDLEGSGAAEIHAPNLMSKVNLAITRLNAVADADGSGNVTSYYNAAKTAKIVWNPTAVRFEFYIPGTTPAVAYIDANGVSAEPGA